MTAPRSHPPPRGGPCRGRRLTSLSLLATGLVCPCHVLVGLASTLTGVAILSPGVQDGLHAVYVPLAVLGGALLWKKR